MEKIQSEFYLPPETAVIPIRSEGVVCSSDVTDDLKATFTGFGEELDWSN